ncbi:MAG: hypothetical protein GX496_03650 [Firmicutes bacterium]|uniref:Uncharacterized protein n=1 Tax=Geochorda subterranea TaxID=3109564 RepID=A0ABZ1BPR7_9FIRM|nr:hypothetical protein [Limnochorda sp. LNt]NLG68650.1 hypothetical protein [Bacillota bacterium]WRP14807.1 hypothetical protein VLY81_01145 [Limnochorda sp. LNt]
MPCFQCPHCGRRHVVRPLDVEEGGRCPCGARYSVAMSTEEPADGVARDDGAGPSTWVMDRDGSVYEVRFHP